jgi:hypothetical protein
MKMDLKVDVEVLAVGGFQQRSGMEKDGNPYFSNPYGLTGCPWLRKAVLR